MYGIRQSPASSDKVLTKSGKGTIHCRTLIECFAGLKITKMFHVKHFEPDLGGVSGHKIPYFQKS